MRQMHTTEYTFNLANRAYFDASVNLRPCLKQILDVEIENIDFAKVNTTQMLFFFCSVTKPFLGAFIVYLCSCNARKIWIRD